MRSVLCLTLVLFALSQLSAVVADSGFYDPKPTHTPLFFENFQGDWGQQWKRSLNPKFAEGLWEVGHGKEEAAIPEDVGLIVKNAARHHAISAAFSAPIDPAGKELVIQYELRLHQSLQCGGAYIKLVQQTDRPFVAEDFSNETPYVIMFGPDRCGATDKVHFIFRHKSPVTGEYEEKHLQYPPTIRNDRNTHLYTLVIRPDNTFELFIDLSSVSKGSLLSEFTPSVNPPKEIDDPDDKKPADWVDEATIPDPNDKKPDDWDENEPLTIPDEDAVKPSGWLDNEPLQVPDPEMEKPSDWNDELDGEWEAPLVDNPKCASAGCGTWTRPTKRNPAYKGKWTPKMIDNPAYKGKWAPRKIANPNYFEDAEPHKLTPMVAVGIENWTMQDEIEFDNFFIGNSLADAMAYAEQTWRVKAAKEKPSTPPAGANSRDGILGKALALFEEYPVATVVTGLLGAVTLLFILSRLCSKSEPEGEDKHDHSHSHSHDHGAHDHSHSHSHGDHHDEEVEEEDELKVDTPAAEFAAATAPVVPASTPVTKTEEKEKGDNTVTQRKKKTRKD